MKRVKNLFEPLISDSNLELAIHDVNASHRWLPRHKPNKTVAWVEEDIPARVKELREIIVGIIDGTVELTPPLKKRRYDRSAGKWRDINEPLLWPDQYVHHALVQVLQPAMMKGMDRYCCGSIQKRGIHYGVKTIKKWMKNDRKGTKYCLQLDIRHFYDSIQPHVVADRMKRLIKDRRVLTLVERVVEHGVLIGIYCSQWFANTILQPLDQMIHQLAAIRAWLAGIGLEVKGDWQVFPTESRLPSALGYRFGRGYTLLRKRNLLRLKQGLARYRKRRRQGRRISRRLAAGLLSRLGQLRHCNHVGVYQRMNVEGAQKELKDVVRKYTRKECITWSTSSGQAA